MDRRRLSILVLVLTAAGYLWLAWNIADASAGRLPDACLWKAVTGVPCPSCGTTRSIMHLAEGDLTGAVMTNPFGLILAGAMIVIPFWVIADLVRGRDGFFRFYNAMGESFSRRRWLPVAAALVAASNWVWNIFKGI
jgi:hypothetical protein